MITRTSNAVKSRRGGHDDGHETFVLIPEGRHRARHVDEFLRRMNVVYERETEMRERQRVSVCVHVNGMDVCDTETDTEIQATETERHERDKERQEERQRKNETECVCVCEYGSETDTDMKATARRDSFSVRISSRLTRDSCDDYHVGCNIGEREIFGD
jgi:hypothetical protein